MPSSNSSLNSSLAAIAALLLCIGCSETLDPITGTTSIKVDLVSPTSGGAADDRLPDTAREVTVNLTALDAQNQPDTSVTGQLDIYTHFLGSLTPSLAQAPLATVTMSNGIANNITVTLPSSFGPTFLWVEDTAREGASFATGTSPELWYREPFLVDVSRPPDEAAADARDRSPLERKQVVIAESQYGARGRLVVTGVYAQGYTLSDVECADAAGTPPCVAGDYDHIFVFTFSRAENEDGRPIFEGTAVDQVGGGISEFNGLTEVNFPSTKAPDEAEPALIPEPAVIGITTVQDLIAMEKLESALVAIDGGIVCPLDEDFQTFGQWKLDLGQGCGDPDNTINIISGGVAADFAPGDFTGQSLPRVVGTLRPINIGSFNIWLVYPRSGTDIQSP